MPYAPGISYRGDQYIAQGNAAGWSALGNALQDVAVEGKKAKALRGALAAYAPEGDEGKAYTAKLQTLGLAELEGESQKQTLQRALQTQKEDRQRQAENDNFRNAALHLNMLTTAATANRQTRDDAQVEEALGAIPGFAADLNYQPATGVEAPLTQPQILARALERNPAIARLPGSSMASQLLERALKNEGAGPRVQMIEGRKFLLNPNGAVDRELSAAPAIPAGFVALGASVDENGKLDVRYGPPKAEGKALSQSEIAGIASLNQAESDLNALEEIYQGLGPDYGGPVAGRVKSYVMGGQNPNVASLENAITAATPNLARGVFREVGVLTDDDIKRYQKLLPAPTDTEEVRKRKVAQLRVRIDKGRKEMVKSLKAAGRNVGGFADETEEAGTEETGSATRFDSEEAARTAGGKAGDIIELYDPATATYRKARLK